MAATFRTPKSYFVLLRSIYHMKWVYKKILFNLQAYQVGLLSNCGYHKHLPIYKYTKVGFNVFCLSHQD